MHVSPCLSPLCVNLSLAIFIIGSAVHAQASVDIQCGSSHVCSDEQSIEVMVSDIFYYRPFFYEKESPKASIAMADSVLSGEFKPRLDVASWAFDLPIDWNANPYAENNWPFLLHSLYMLDPLLIAFDQTKEKKYLEGSLAIVFDWQNFHGNGGRSEYSWYNMAVGVRSLKIAHLAAMASKLPEYSHYVPRLQKLAQNHIVPVVIGEIPLRKTNHGIFQMHGLKALCVALPEMKECSIANAFVRYNLSKVISAQFDSEGMHLEHSPQYYNFVLNTLNSLKQTGWYDDIPVLKYTIEKMPGNFFWMVDPSNRFFAIGDSGPTLVPGSKIFAPNFAECHKMVQQSCVFVRHFSEAGYVIVKSPRESELQNAFGLFIQAGFHSDVHKHLDDLTFELFEKGEKIVSDSGFYGYKEHPNRRYVKRTRAHNTVEVDDTDFSRNPAFAYGNAVDFVKRYRSYIIVQATVNHSQQNFEHRRQYIFKPGDWFIVRDLINSNVADRKVTHWFNFTDKAELEEQHENGARMKVGDVNFDLNVDSNCAISIEKGVTNPRMSGWYSPSINVIKPSFAIGFECDQIGNPVTTTIAFSPAAKVDAASVM